MPCYSASKSLSLKPQSISQISHCFITSWAVLFSVAEYSLCPYHIFDGFEENQSRQIQLSQQPKAEKNVKTEDLCQILSKTGFFFFSIGYKLIKTTVKNYSTLLQVLFPFVFDLYQDIQLFMHVWKTIYKALQ